MKRIGFIGLGIMGKPEVVFRTPFDKIDVRINASIITP
jgi:hypothetical protein